MCVSARSTVSPAGVGATEQSVAPEASMVGPVAVVGSAAPHAGCANSGCAFSTSEKRMTATPRGRAHVTIVDDSGFRSDEGTTDAVHQQCQFHSPSRGAGTCRPRWRLRHAARRRVPSQRVVRPHQLSSDEAVRSFLRTAASSVSIRDVSCDAVATSRVTASLHEFVTFSSQLARRCVVRPLSPGVITCGC